MTHTAARPRLSAYLDDELLPGERRVVASHLQSCADCRDELARLDRVRTLLGALPDVEPPAALFQDVRRRLESRRSPLAPVAEWLAGTFRRPAAVAALAVLVILLVSLPLVKGRIDRLAAANVGVDVYVREHAVLSRSDPFVDRAYLGLLIGDANVALVGQRRGPEESR